MAIDLKTLQDELTLLYEAKNYKALKAVLEELDAIDIADFLDELPWENFAVIFRLLPKELGHEVFIHLDTEAQEHLLNALEDPQVGELIASLYNDDLADILDELPADMVKRILRNTSSNRRKEINILLQYPEDSAGSIMTTEYMHLEQDLTIEEAFQKLRRTKAKLETIYSCYVTDRRNVLIGVITVRDIFASKAEALVSDIMEEAVVSVNTHDDQEEVANLFTRYDFLAMPVTDRENRLVGIITVDDAMDVIKEEAVEDMQKMAAVMPSEEDYLTRSPFSHAKSRILWLMVLMFSGYINAYILTRFEEAFLLMPALVGYIPMLTGTGGNAGLQSSATIIRALTLEEISFRDWGRALWKEIRVGLLLGLVLGMVNCVRVYFMDGRNFPLALTVSVALLFIATSAKILGTSLPMLAKKFKLDPAVMAGPLINTLLDAITLLIYFGVSYLIIFSRM